MHALRIGALMLAVLASCAPSPEAGPGPEQAPAAAADGVAPVAPLPGPNLLYNGNFEEWEGARPKGWAVAQGAGATWTTVAPGKVKGLGRGSMAVELPVPAADTVVILAQNLSARWIAPGRPLRFGVLARADRPDQAQVVLQYQSPAGLQKARVAHPGDGEWHALEATVEIPADADPATFRIEMFRYPGDAGRVLFENAGVVYADGAPPPAQPEPSPGA
jgi:hypothetical protein